MQPIGCRRAPFSNLCEHRINVVPLFASRRIRPLQPFKKQAFACLPTQTPPSVECLPSNLYRLTNIYRKEAPAVRMVAERFVTML